MAAVQVQGTGLNHARCRYMDMSRFFGKFVLFVGLQITKKQVSVQLWREWNRHLMGQANLPKTV